ncbi:MAG: ABC transporter ATP-binding protein [Pirellulales bacterium]
MPVLVQTFGLTKTYPRVAALADCSLGVPQGEIFGLLGPNGSGKTTLLRLLLGFLKPTAGRALVGDFDCAAQSLAVRGLTSYLPAEARLPRRLRGAECLELFCRLRPGSSATRARDLASRLELDLTRPVSMMSTGMRQKTALAIALADDSPLVILDEPTANLDPTARSEVLRMVVEVRDAGRTVIFSSHVLSEVEEICDRVAVLRYGEFVHEQPLAELRKRHRIELRLHGELPPLPAGQADAVTVTRHEHGLIRLETDGELAPLLGWLAALPIAEIRIEPIRLQAVYERFHSPKS